MTDPNLLEVDPNWEIIQEPFLPGLNATYSSPDSNFDVYPLSPLLFEECSLDKLWSLPAKRPTPEASIGLKIKSELKNLSWSIKEIISKRKVSTYKEVANELISELASSSELTKDVRNIRRKIYDAINVLTATNIIEKQGKQIVLKPKINAERSVSVTKKKEKLVRLMDSYIATKNLFEQNSLERVARKVPYPLTLISLGEGSDYIVSFM